MWSKSFLFVALLLILLSLNSLFGKGPWYWGVGFVYIGYDTALLLFVSWQMIRILKNPKIPPLVAQESGRLTLAVLITARNESAVLKRCLDALDAQIDLPDSVYWIDDGSIDSTRYELEMYQWKRVKNFLPHFKTHSGKADSLNQVWPHVSADILVTLDADTLLEPAAIAAIRKAFTQNPQLAVTGGLLTPQHLGGSGKFFENFQRFEYIRSFLARRAWMNKDALVLVSGAFAAYRKQVLVEVGGYDPKSLVEDYDLTHRIYRYSFDHRKNYQVNVSVEARAYTDVPVTLKQFLRQRKRWFAGFLPTQFKNGDLVGNPRYGNFGRVMLVIKSADTLQPIFGLITLLSLAWLLYQRQSLPTLVWEALLAKIIIDLVFHYASVALYFRWRNERAQMKTWGLSTVSTFLEPVSFQILRHLGALLGWIDFIRKRQSWAPQRAHLKQD